jgi:hypothetical protein
MIHDWAHVVDVKVVQTYGGHEHCAHSLELSTDGRSVHGSEHSLAGGQYAGDEMNGGGDDDWVVLGDWFVVPGVPCCNVASVSISIICGGTVMLTWG